jgi:hypothetical protein
MITRSVGWGAVFGAIAFSIVGAWWALHWASMSHRPGELELTMPLYVVFGAMTGGPASAALFAVVGAIMSSEPAGIKPSAFSFAVVSSVVMLGAVILPFASWMAGGWLPAIRLAQNVYAMLPTLLLPMTITGFLVGWKVEEY